jgi:hypothetical protein
MNPTQSSLLRASLLCLCLAVGGVPGHADEPIIMPQLVPDGPPDGSAAASAAPKAAHSTEASPEAWHQRYDPYFRRNWGVEVLGVHAISSGWMLQFKYRILDSGKAALLNEKRSKAFVIDEATDIRLSVPAMENIGELRQAPRPEEGRIYYIIFGNPNQLVKKGGRVDVVIGRFRADGVFVE